MFLLGEAGEAAQNSCSTTAKEEDFTAAEVLLL